MPQLLAVPHLRGGKSCCPSPALPQLRGCERGRDSLPLLVHPEPLTGQLDGGPSPGHRTDPRPLRQSGNHPDRPHTSEPPVLQHDDVPVRHKHPAPSGEPVGKKRPGEPAQETAEKTGSTFSLSHRSKKNPHPDRRDHEEHDPKSRIDPALSQHHPPDPLIGLQKSLRPPNYLA